jgi:hypothetical protein
MVSGIPLDAALTDELLWAARDMVRLGTDRLSISTTDARGIVKTRFHTVVFGSITGAVFQAEVETESGRTRTRFIVDSAEIPDEDFERFERGEWSEYPATRAHLN